LNRFPSDGRARKLAYWRDLHRHRARSQRTRTRSNPGAS
jgi:hypothetical protein